MITGMVTSIHTGRKRRLYLVEHRKAKKVSPEDMAGRLDITRQSVHRWEREQWRMDPEKQAAYAAALGLEPEDLWRPPGIQSVDALLAKAPDSVRQEALTSVISILVRTGTHN